MKSARVLLTLMSVCCLLWGSIEATPQYHLSCPHLDDDTVGTCAEECTSDDDCSSGQLCCSNGCGHTCIEATRTPYYALPTDPMCPPVNDDFAGTCDERCANDSECSTGEMCCSNGCGHVCMAPLSACKAVLHTVSNQSLIGSYQPQCDEDGGFSRVQCHGSTGYCWCVDPESGRPVSDNIRFKEPQCNCTYDGVTHYAGESFAAGDGCNECHCTVDGGVKCTELDVPCPGQELFYSCPAVRADTAGICEHACSLNSECPHSRKCCYNGCGHTCQLPVPIPYVRLSETTSCPSTDEVPCVDQEGGGSCRDPAFGCDEGEICCDNDCASAVCLSLSELKPCLTAKKLSVGNSSKPLLGAYRPRCDEDGLFRDIQCHEHYCWCVEKSTGRPTSDMATFENSDDLQCSGCVYNGRKYHLHDRFPSTDGCNQCTCFRGGVSCTERACLPRGEGPQGGRTDSDDDGDDDHLWEWWHTMLIACIAVVIILGIVVVILIASVFVLVRQNGQYRHQKLKEEVLPVKYEPDEEVQFKTGQDSIELKVPVEDNDDHKPAHA